MKKIITIILCVIIIVLIASCQHLKEEKTSPSKSAKHVNAEKTKTQKSASSVQNKSKPTTSATNSTQSPAKNVNSATKSVPVGSNPNISVYTVYNQNWYAIYDDFVNKSSQYSNLNVAFSLSKDEVSSGGASIYTGTFYQYGQSGIQYIKISVTDGVATVKLLNPPRSSSGGSNISPYIRAILKYSMQNSPIPGKLYQN